MKSRFSYILIIFLLHYPFFASGQACIDSSFRILYSTPAALFSLRHHGNAGTGGIIMTGNYGIGAGDRDAFVMKTAPDGAVVWSKRLFAPGKAIQVSRVMELSDNTILLTGLFCEQDLTNARIFIAKLDDAGNLLWNKFYDETGTPAAWQLFFYNVAEAPDGKILATWKRGNLGNLPSDSSYATVCCLDQAGNMVWSKTFFGNADEYNINVSGIFFQNDEVVVTGQVSDFYNPAGCNGTGNFIVLRLRLTDGSLLQTKAWCYSEPSGNGQQHSSPEIHYAATQVNNNYIALHGQFHNLNQERYYYHVLLDETLNPVQSQLFVLPTGLAPFNSKIQVLSDATIHLSAIAVQSRSIYWAAMDGTYQARWQKKIRFTVDNSNFSQFYQFSTHTNGAVNFTSLYPTSSQQYIEWGQFPQFSSGMELCSSADTSFITTMPFSVTPENYSWKLAAERDITSLPAGISVADITVTRNEACKLISNCTGLTITGDDTICATTHTIFTAHKNPGCLNKINWYLDTAQCQSLTYLNDSTISVVFKNPAASKQEIWLAASAGNCSLAADTLHITVFPEINRLAAPGNLCPHEELVLRPGSGFKSYRWQDGSEDSVYVAKEPGLYHVQVETWCGDIIADTIAIDGHPAPAVNLGADTFICENESVHLQAGDGFNTYTWNTGASAPAITVNKPGLYTVTVTDINGCRATDTIVVILRNCINRLVFPNAFTPNGDGRNDLFRPVVSGNLTSYILTIYNRWGQRIFSTSNPSSGWNGRLRNGKIQSDGYVWVCTYQFEHEPPKTDKGMVMLIGK